jgi:hypothetical protein
MDSNLGMMEKPMSPIAAMSVSQLIEQRGSEDLDNSDEKMARVEPLTWNRF